LKIPKILLSDGWKIIRGKNLALFILSSKSTDLEIIYKNCKTVISDTRTD
jgi:hypothetical protein